MKKNHPSNPCPYRAVRKACQAGFTMLELLVVISIIAVLSTLVLFNHGKLNSAILVSNTAYEVGLIIREAQIAGLAVRATDNTGLQDFTYSQGVHIDMAYPNQVTLFSDKNGDGRYSGSTEDVQVYLISNGRAGKLLSVCAIIQSYGVAPTCTSTSDDYTPVVDILFTRPNPEAFFKTVDKTVTQPGDGTYILQNHTNPIAINIGFEGDICRTIGIQKTGAVQVDTAYCVPMQ